MWRPHFSSLTKWILSNICVTWKGCGACQYKVDPSPFTKGSRGLSIAIKKKNQLFPRPRFNSTHVYSSGPWKSEPKIRGHRISFPIYLWWHSGKQRRTWILTEHGVKLLRVQIPFSPRGLMAFRLGVTSMVKLRLGAEWVQDSEHAPERKKCSE